MSKFGFHRNGRQRWICRRCGITSVEAHRKKGNPTPEQLYISEEKITILRMFYDSGMTQNEVQAQTRVSKNVIQKLFRAWDTIHGERLCRCGKKAVHRGWCWWRYRNSPKRQEFIKNWHDRTAPAT